MAGLESYDLHVTRPIWLPYNTEAHVTVNQLCKTFGYPSEGPKAAKYRVVVSSLLKATQSAIAAHKHSKPQYLGIQRRASAWSQYPLVGREIAKKVVSDYLVFLHATQVEGSGNSRLHKDEHGRWRTDPKMSMYMIDKASCPDDLTNAKFIQVGRGGCANLNS